MIDNKITEMKSLSKLKKAGKFHYWHDTIEIPEIELHMICNEIQEEYDRAIAALNKAAGNWAKADALLRKLENDINDNRTIEFIDEPDTIRNEAMDNDLSMTDNRTTELREMLMERGVEWIDESNGFADVTTFIANGAKWTVISKSYLNPEHDWMTMNAERITPEQAIAATLGSEREAELVRVMEDVLRHSTDTVWVGEAETLVDRMVSLGVYKHDVYEGARPWEVD